MVCMAGCVECKGTAFTQIVLGIDSSGMVIGVESKGIPGALCDNVMMWQLVCAMAVLSGANEMAEVRQFG